MCSRHNERLLVLCDALEGRGFGEGVGLAENPSEVVVVVHVYLTFTVVLTLLPPQLTLTGHSPGAVLGPTRHVHFAFPFPSDILASNPAAVLASPML
jgi:hypothetical protein